MGDDLSTKRRAAGQAGRSAKIARTGTSGSAKNGAGTVPAAGGGMTFAQKMMAKMGYQGGGLGKDGEGMVTPVEVKLRPQGVGLGAVKEMTKQAKEETKRQAERNGEVVDDSSDEDRKKRATRQPQRGHDRGTPTSGVSTPSGRVPRAKTKFKTAADFEAAAAGLEVPNVLKNIIDATGRPAVLTPTGLIAKTTFQRAETEAEKVANRARRDLEGFVTAWNKNESQKLYNTQAIEQCETQLKEAVTKIEAEEVLIRMVEQLESLELSKACLAMVARDKWESVTTMLEDMQSQCSGRLEHPSLTEVAVAAIAPLFKQEMIDWNPLETPTHLVEYLARLSHTLGLNRLHERHGSEYDNFNPHNAHRHTSPYEALIQSLWLPRVRTAIINEWDVHAPSTLVVLVDTWKPLLPGFIYTHVVEGIIVKRLYDAIKEWNPRKAYKKKHSAHHHADQDLPHIWLFPWLQHVDAHHLDPKSSDGLLSEMRRKFRSAVDHWDLSRGVMLGLEAWRDLLGASLVETLINHLLPRLSTYLSRDFEIDPGDQAPYMVVLRNILAWRDFLPAKAMGRLLQQDFFRKWLDTLHHWLTTPGADRSQIDAWVAWWQTQFPSVINDLPSISSEWARGAKMIEDARRLGARAATDLPAPAAGPSLPLNLTDKPPVTPSGVHHPRKEEQPLTYKQLVEHFCDEQSLLCMPLREAHPTNGRPLFRITASATATGGVVAYVEDKMLWARWRGQAEYMPVGLTDELVTRAELR